MKSLSQFFGYHAYIFCYEKNALLTSDLISNLGYYGPDWKSSKQTNKQNEKA